MDCVNKSEFDLADHSKSRSQTFKFVLVSPKMHKLCYADDDLMCCINGITLTRSL